MEKVAELAERLNEAIKDKTSTTKLADQIGMSKQAISAYTTGVRVPKRPVINALAEALGINPLWLMGYDVGKYDNVTATIPGKGSAGQQHHWHYWRSRWPNGGICQHEARQLAGHPAGASAVGDGNNFRGPAAGLVP